MVCTRRVSHAGAASFPTLFLHVILSDEMTKNVTQQMFSSHGGRDRGHRHIRQITADTCTDEISSSRANRNLLLPLIFDGNVLCRYAQGERKRIRLACHPAHAHAHMSDSLLRKMLRRKTRAHRPHMMQQHTKTLKGTDDRYIDKLQRWTD